MGLLQKAVETFDAHGALAGKVEAGHQPLAPIGHMIATANIEITLDENGVLLDAVPVEREDGKTIIPATENSAGRTRAPCAHPLCEQIGYLSGQDEGKYTLYVKKLRAWAESEHSHAMLHPILAYVQKKSLLSDLAAHGIRQLDDKQLIRWRVLGIGEESGLCWTNQSLFLAFQKWYESVEEQKDAKAALCMISGERALPARQHPKGIIPINGNAKLVSSNDDSNFTYRGRFTDDIQALTISYTASQKAHNALRWLAAEQGAQVVFGGRTFLCWNPQGKRIPHPAHPFYSRTTAATAVVSPTNYQEELRRTLEGARSELPTTAGVVIAAFDAATTGRLAVTYYNELLASDFLHRLYAWDSTCCWWGWNRESHRYDAVRAPFLLHIVHAAFGVQRVEKGNARLVVDERVVRQQMQRLLSCRVDGMKFPADIERALVARASRPQAYDTAVYMNLLSITCAVIRKYYYDQKGEELSMTLEKGRADRSYQFGRLLAVLEKVERDTYKDKEENREPNAIRFQSVYCRRPLHTANMIESQLERAYLPRLKPWQRRAYKDLIGEILEQISSFPEQELDKALGDTYLIGYYLQRRALYQSKDQQEEENENGSSAK